MRILLLILLISIDRVLKIVYFNNFPIINDFYATKGLLIILGIVGITLLKMRNKYHFSVYWYSLLLIGGFSNLIDLIIYNRVIDYINIFSYILNFSDIIISVGVVILIFDILKYENNHK